MSKEDALTAAVVEQKQQEAGENETVSVSVEVHYNHYGDRGVADLVTETTYGNGGRENSTIEIWELKADAAIEAATGANEILRQFNRHKEYFFKGSDYHQRDYYRTEFNLLFHATETAMNHINGNEPMYRSGTTQKIDVAGEHANLMVFHPEMGGFAFPLSEHDFQNADRLEEAPTLPHHNE